MYIINKKIRHDKKRLPLKDIVNKLFTKKDNAVEGFFRNVDMKNFEDLMDQMDELVIERLKDKYLKLKILYKDLRSNNTLKLHKNEDFLELSEDFTNVSNQLKEAYSSMYFREARKSKKLFCFNEGQNLVDCSINLVKFNSKAYILRARFMEQNEECIQFALEDCNRAIFMEPCAALNYMEKAKFLEKLGRYDEYDSVLSCVLKFGKITKDVCRNAIDIFEFRGELETALKWTKVAMDIDDKDLEIIEKEKRLRNMLDDRFEMVTYEKEKNDEPKVLPTKVEGNLRKESSFGL